MQGGRDRERPVRRPTARVIAVDPRQRILLMEGRTRWAPRIWFTPGGALEAGETSEDAARRELWEETGLRLGVLGPAVWLRDHVWQDVHGGWWRSVERFYWASVPCFEPDAHRMSLHERATVGDPRWWTLQDISAGEHTFAPRRLAALLVPLLRGNFPDAPFDVGL